jgi:hypothetical protein
LPATRAGRYLAEFGRNLAAGLDAIAQAAVARRWREVLAGADSSHFGTRRLREEAIVDALDAGADWWAVGQVLRLHPQTAFDLYANLRDGTRTPAQQRPHLVLLLTAGLVDVHHPCPEYGRDVDTLAVPGLNAEPRAQQIRAAARTLRRRAWIRVALPEGRHTGEPIGELDIISRWTSVAHDDVELAVLREALAVKTDL